MPISNPYPYTLTNGTTADATQVMADFLQIQNDVNANAAPLGSPAFTGIPTAPTAAPGTNTTQLATTAYATAAIAALTATFAPLASPAFTGTPTAPTATAGDSTTQIATTAFTTGGIATAIATLTSTVNTALALKAPLASPALTGTPTAPTASAGTSSTQIATTAFAAGSFSAAATGYQILPSGIIIQWGVGSTVGNNVNQTISFPIAFTTALYSVNATAFNSSITSDDGIFTVSNFSTSGFQTVCNTSGISFAPSWIAVGK